MLYHYITNTPFSEIGALLTHRRRQTLNISDSERCLHCYRKTVFHYK